MQQQFDNHIFTGMQRDLSISKHPANYLFDALNIRITARDGNTLLSITNERGPKDLNVLVSGTYLGHCTLNLYLVVFSTTSTGEVANGLDYITRIDLSNPTAEPFPLYNSARGNLKFSVKHKIEAIASYENDDIQKVYWTDGLNQPRVINVSPKSTQSRTDKSFDFVQELALNETVSIKKVYGKGGMFAPGAIQYAFSYYNKHGQESNLFYVSTLLYTSHIDRGGSPEEKVSVAFKITVNNIDKNFDYLRIYSIQRTSIDATPIVKRIQDISINRYAEGNVSLSYIDTGIGGEDVDPTQLLYIGGEEILAKTLEQKDGTLFLGNLEIKRPTLNDDIQSSLWNYGSVSRTSPEIKGNAFSEKRKVQLQDGNILSVVPTADNNYMSAKGFKSNEYYRLGLQFQYKNGKWSRPYWIGDTKVTSIPRKYSGFFNYDLEVPKIEYYIAKDVAEEIFGCGYYKVRPLIASPTINDRTILCQGVANSTVYRDRDRFSDPIGKTGDGPIYAQASWIFRPTTPTKTYEDYFKGGVSQPWSIKRDGSITHNKGPLNSIFKRPEFLFDGKIATSQDILSTEIGTYLSEEDEFRVDTRFITINSPDIEFDTDLQNYDYSGYGVIPAGAITVSTTYADIDIQTSSPTISSKGGGFIHKTYSFSNGYSLISDFVYNDDIAIDVNDGKEIRPFEDPTYTSNRNWLVYMWHKNGSLNNDINRPANLGTRSAELLKKKISNYRYASTSIKYSDNIISVGKPELFNSDQLSVIKINNLPYYGNIDTLISTSLSDNDDIEEDESYNVPFFVGGKTSSSLWPSGYWEGAVGNITFFDIISSSKGRGIVSMDFANNTWELRKSFTSKFKAFAETSEPVRMRYKSTPHIVAQLDKDIESPIPSGEDNGELLLVELRKNYDKDLFYGGTSDDALQQLLWIPAGEPVRLDNLTRREHFDRDLLWIDFVYGDTYYTRYECLKTYAFSPEDINQVVDILSFNVETRVNLGGRYDRNKDQHSHLNMSPTNFNLLNSVYNQQDNFFNYRILDEDFYKPNKFSNQITWTKEKQAGADTDAWTNITLASTYDMDGSKGLVQSLNTWQDLLYCFQDKGISNILFNSRVQIPTSDGVPIEITNSYKVDGYRYITDGTGCTNKYTIKETATGIYFIDSVTNNLYHIGEGVSDIATTHNMATWFKNNEVLKTVYDDVNHDVYLIGQNDALCYSEVMKEFTSRMSYEGVSLLESYGNSIFTMHNSKLYEFGTGEYNMFFGTFRPWLIDFISNGVSNQANNSTLDKVFDNLEYRMDRYSKDATTGIWKNEHQKTLDYIRVFNEYQDTGYVDLSLIIDRASSISNLKKKFRVWRVNIPRNKVIKDSDGTYKTTGKRDRIRNTWCNIELGIKDANTDKVEMHDMNVIYYM